jgi:hypothetical protein
MPAPEPPENYSIIDSLLEAGDLDGAREMLELEDGGNEAYAVLRCKLALYDGSLPPGAVMQKLIQLMRRDASWPGAKALYDEASNFAYQSRQSSTAYSHPPPPVQRRERQDK